MSNYAVANRYSVALFQLAKEQGTLKQIGDDLQLVKDVFEQTPELKGVLAHPKVSKADKETVIKENFEKAVSAPVLNTLLLLIEVRRDDIILSLIDKYKQLAYNEQGMAEAIVYSVKPLSDEDKEVISKQFAKKVGKETLMINNVVDDKLIGGLKIRIGDRIYDGSVKGQLDRLQRQLIGASR